VKDATHAVAEPQHGTHLETTHEHGGDIVECTFCGRMWTVNGSVADIVAEGDGYCDENGIE
jgi:hypothetical protein